MGDGNSYQQHPDRYEYLPTGKATDFVPAMLALVACPSNRGTAREPAGSPVSTRGPVRRSDL